MIKIKKGDILIDKYGRKYKYLGKCNDSVLLFNGFKYLLLEGGTRQKIIVSDVWKKYNELKLFKRKSV